MTTKTLFNWGIFKSNLKRFYLGSVLYFIILFMSTGMIYLLGYEPGRRNEEWWGYDRLLRDGGTFFAFIVSCGVCTVVALLVYRFVHSKKTGIFIHSMPVTRLENYVSTLLASMVLMIVPLVLNTIILLIMSQTGYGYLFTAKSCFIWLGMNVLTIFIMFAVSTLSAMLVGNSFALVTINAFIHAVLPIVGLLLEGLFSQFLYGYIADASFFEKLSRWTPLAYLSYTVADIAEGDKLSLIKMGAYIILAIVFYVAGYLLYRKRNIETSEDVAAYKCLNPIMKYIVTFLASVGAYTILGVFITEKPVLFVSVVIIVSAVVYFALEMVLKKKIKIWTESYKGYLGFLAVFAIIMCLVTFTSVFGYETYVPESDEVGIAAIYNYYYQDLEPYTQSGEINEYITRIHKKILEDEIPINDEDFSYDYDTRIHIRYELKNGKSIARTYGISTEFKNEVMAVLYEYAEYKKACEEVYRKDAENIIEVELNGEYINGTVAQFNELLECIRHDMEKLDYNDIHLYSDNDYQGRCYLHYITENEYGDIYNSMHVDITKKYVETIKWFENQGYGAFLKNNVKIGNKINMNPASIDEITISNSSY